MEEDEIKNILLYPSITTFCFISIYDYYETHEQKFNEYLNIKFVPRYSLELYVDDPKTQLNLMERYLKHNLEKEKYKLIKKGFYCVIFIDNESLSECQILINNEDEEKEIYDYIKSMKIRSYCYK